MGLYTYKDHPKLDEIKQIKEVIDIKKLNLKPISNLGNGWHKQNIDIYGIKTLYVKEDENIIQVLEQEINNVLKEMTNEGYMDEMAKKYSLLN